MIVDTLTHVWESPEQLGQRTGFAGREDTRLAALAATRPGSRANRDPLADRLLHADPLEHFESIGPVDFTLVYSFQSRMIDAKVPLALVGNYVRGHTDRLIGVAGIDPTAPDVLDQMDQAVDQYGFKAVAISPSAQGFHPMDSRVQAVYRELVRRDLPAIVHCGPYPSPVARLDFADPILLDEVVREFPDLRLVLGGLTHPWIDRSLALMTKHPGVLASVGGLLRSPWQAYNALVLAQELGVLDRLMFASDFPFSLPVTCIEALYSINRLAHGTNLPTIPRELLRGIVERDALALLGIEPPKVGPPGATQSAPSVSAGPAAAPRPDEPAAPSKPAAPAELPAAALSAADPAASDPPIPPVPPAGPADAEKP